MSTLVSDAAAVEFEGQEPWPSDVRLYQPYEVDQILLPQFASCLSVKAFLKMSQLNFSVVVRSNAEHMSPSGKVPFMQIGQLLVSELDPIISVVNNKGHNLSSFLSNEERSDMRAYMTLIENVLINAELYLSWCDDTIANNVTKGRYGSAYPWPLNWILPFRQQREIRQLLASIHWTDKTKNEVLEEIRTCCQALSEKLGEQRYFFGDKPTELDAMVFGHLFTLVTTVLPSREVAEVIDRFENLSAFCRHVETTYFRETELPQDS